MDKKRADEMATILLEPQNPLDITSDELEQLATIIRAIDPVTNVTVVNKEAKGYGVTWWEVVYVWIQTDPIGSGIAGYMIGKVFDGVIAWARERFKKKDTGRPFYISILDSEGKVMQSILLHNADQEPEDRTEQDREQEPRKLPPMQDNTS